MMRAPSSLLAPREDDIHEGAPLPHDGGASEFLAGGGVRDLIRATDWSKTPLGAVENWSVSLRIAVSICVGSRFPIVLYWGPHRTVLYNDAYAEILGKKHPGALGRPCQEVWLEIWDVIAPMLDGVFATGQATWSEDQLLVLERGGYPEECYFSFSFSPVQGEDSKVEGIFCAVVENTRRVLGDRRLRTLRNIAERAGAAKDEKRVWLAAAAALGENPKDLPFAALYRSGEGTAALLASAYGIERPPTSIELPCPAFEGAEVLPISRGGGKPYGHLVAGVSSHRRLDGEYRSFLALAADHIATAVANARAHEEERERSEALAELDRAKTTFFSNVSHEFRTPLTLMLGPLEESLARADELPPDERERVGAIHRNGLRLLKLVNSLLDFSRIEAGRVRATYEPVDLAAFTAELASNFRSVVEKAGLRFAVNCATLPQPVHVDRDMWEKVVLNLLSNAFKFTFEGQIVVEVRTSADGAHAEAVVRDTGTGIPQDQLPHLFERFRRIEGAKGRSFEGSGIGLALVQELVKLHGGDIEAESTVGEGSAFTVRVPFGTAHLPKNLLSPAAHQQPTNIRAEAYVQEAMAWLRRSGSVLQEISPAVSIEGIAAIEGAENRLVFLADDNADMRDYVARLLRASGFRVEAFADGEQLLRACADVAPALVLADVMMPILDGFGLLNALRADNRLRDIPVLLLSARAGEEAKIEGLKYGADDYLTKPFSARELLARVEANLKLARLRRESEATVREDAALLEQLNRVGNAVAAEIDLERAVQVVTDAATKLSGAAFGAFFYNVIDEKGESYTLYTLSGAPREAFAKFPQPRNTAVFGPTFRGEAIVRSPDITTDPRYGQNPPYCGNPPGHLPVRSYLAVPVVSHTGEVLGGLFFGHPEIDIFDERAERLVAGIATQAAIAIDKARLFGKAQSEIERRRTVEAALRESEQSLEAKVAERTAELVAANDRLRSEAIERQRIEDQLRQAQKMEAIGHLTGGVAHDFNNLLTIVIGNIESIQRNLDVQTPSRVRRWVENAMHGAKRAASLTQHLLAFSRRQPLEPKPVELNRVISNLSQMLARTLGEKIEVQTVLGAGLWRVEVDPNQLETTIVNLAVNARDAMPDGGKLTIETANAHLCEANVAAASEVTPGQYVVVAVSDSGYGMTNEVIEHAFEPFFTTKPTGHGTGLGLSQVYGFVKQSGGHVRLYSEAGQGTTVKIYLRRLVGDAAIEQPTEGAVPDRSGKETVLVVEDDANVREYSAELLRELGYTVIEAEDGPAALRHIERFGSVDLLFTDLGLPGMSGRDLAEEARRRRPEIKVLYATGYARYAVVHHGRLDPGVQLIAKPFTYADLGSKLRQVLDELD